MGNRLQYFLESCRSEHTRKIYRYYLDRFIAHNSIKDYDELAGMEPNKIQIMVEDYTMYLKKTISPNSIPTTIYGIKAFLDSCDIELKWHKIKKLFPDKVKLSGKKAWTRDQIKTMLANAKDSRARALILFLASSGVRIGVIPDLKVKHLSKIEDSVIVTAYAEDRSEYVTFLTPEASNALAEYFYKRKQDHEDMNQDSPVFRTIYKIGSSKAKAESKSSLQEVIRHILIKCGYRQRNPGVYRRYETQIDNGFRKYVNQTFKETAGMNLSYAEKMLGHSVTISLDNNYLNPEIDTLYNEYKKAIPFLTIDDTQRQQIKITQLQDETNKLKAKETEVEILKKQAKETRLKLDYAMFILSKLSKGQNVPTVKEFMDVIVNDNDPDGTTEITFGNV